MKKTLLLFSALLMTFSLTWAQEKGTPAAENKKADENSTEKVADKVPDTYANDFTYTRTRLPSRATERTARSKT